MWISEELLLTSSALSVQTGQQRQTDKVLYALWSRVTSLCAQVEVRALNARLGVRLCDGGGYEEEIWGFYVNHSNILQQRF